MADIDKDKLHKTLSEFLENKFWAKYYGEAPSVAKEFIALEMYASDNDVDDDPDFDELQKEVEEAMEDEDKQYLADNSPSQYERARFAKMLNGGGEVDGDDDGGKSIGENGESDGEGGGEEANPKPEEENEEADETVLEDDGPKMGGGESTESEEDNDDDGDGDGLPDENGEEEEKDEDKE